MMQHQKLKWALILFLVPSLILGLTACPPVTTTEEKTAEGPEAEGPAPTEEATIVTEPTAEETEAETPAPTEEAITPEESEAETLTPTEEATAVTEPTAEETEAETLTPTEESATYEVDIEAPTVVSTTPPNGSQDVSPDITKISVTFSEAMMDKSWSWAYEQQDKFPQITGDPGYDASFTVNTLPVELEPNKEYEIWINTSRFKNFTDKVGNPAAPYKLVFKTK